MCDALQIIRQFVFESSGRSSSSDATGPNAAVLGEPKSVVCGALYQLLMSVAAASRDGFVNQVLALAHELADEGLQNMNGFALRQGLELVAAVSSAQVGSKSSPHDAPSSSPSGAERADCYREWVRDHFAAHDDGDGKRQRSDSNPTSSNPIAGVRRCLKQQSGACALVTSKRQIQFLCAFLLEFDRREYPNTGAKTPSTRFPVARPDHVAAHLSVMKTHQPQFSSGGLIMDFCSQTRSRYLELLQMEQAAAAAGNTMKAAGTELSGKASAVLATYSAKVRTMVRENIQLYNDTSKLSPQLRQWKMFQPKLWKQELIPCCLDIQYASGEVPHGQGDGEPVHRAAAESDLLAHVAFVHAMAKSGMVSVREYALFLSSAERWLDERRATMNGLKKRAHKRRRSAMEGDELERALERLQAEMEAQGKTRSSWGASLSVSENTMDALKQALGSTLSMLQDTTPRARSGEREVESVTSKPMQRLWDDGCVRVLEMLGLEQVDTFFAYLVPILVRSSPHDHAPAHPESDVKDGSSEIWTSATVSVVEFFVSQTSWAGVDDPRFLLEICCVGAATAALLGQFSADFGRPNLPRLLQLIDNKCGSRSVASTLPATGRLTHDHVVNRALFVSTMLRAASALPSESDLTWNVTALLRCKSLDAEFREFVLWMGMRSTASTTPRTTSVLPQDVTHSEIALLQAAVQRPLQVLSNNLCALTQTRWFKEVFDPRTLAPATLEQVIRLEFRYGLTLFGDSAVLNKDRRGRSREWLQLELDLIEDLGGSRVAAVEDIVEWVIAEILLQTTTIDDVIGDDCIRNSALVDSALEVMLLALNDLIYKAGSRRASTLEGRDVTTTSAHDRIFAFYVDSATQLIRESDGVLPINRTLQHHSFEILEICSRHCDRADSSKQLRSALTQGGFVQLLGAIGVHFKERFPWSLLQALFIYLTHAMVDLRDVQAPALDVRAIPDTIVVRCALEFSNLEKAFERRSTRKNGAGRRQETFIDHLRRLHAIIGQIISPTDSQDTSARKLTVGMSDEVFPVEADWTRFQIRVVKLLFSWNAIRTPDATLEPHLLSSFHTHMAKRVLRVLGVDSESGDSVTADTSKSGGKLADLALCLVEEWIDAAAGIHSASSAGDVNFQLLLIHAVAEVCQRSALACKKVLLSWRDSRASMVDGAGLFLVLLGITLSNKDDSFEHVLRMNSSLWLNEFSQVALHIHSTSSSSAASSSNMITSKVSKVVANSQSFEYQLVRVLGKVLKHGIVNQVDVIDATVPRRIQQVWPRLRDSASRLPVLLHVGESSEY